MVRSGLILAQVVMLLQDSTAMRKKGYVDRQQMDGTTNATWDPRTMKMTHYWDCAGQGCDSTTLQPWDPSKYVSPPGYGPQDPDDFGGAVYGEKMWLTGAASDALSQVMGADDGCCGSDGSGACGKCLLIQVPSAVESSWTAVVMKKNRCPPWSNGCSSGTPHFDVAAPGFDNLQYSTANICGRQGTGFTSKQQSESLGKWYHSCQNTAQCAHLCNQLEPEFQTGCKLFASWGWKRGDPDGVKFRAVACPDAFVSHVQGLFDRNGVVGGGSGSSTSSPNASPSPTPSTGTSGGCCSFEGKCGGPTPCGSDGTGWCHQSSSNCGVCGGQYDSNVAAPSCGGPATSSPTASPTAPPTASQTASPTARPTATPTASQTANPTPTPNTAHGGGGGGGCCIWGRVCGVCGSDTTSWCHQSASRCEVNCGGTFCSSNPAPSPAGGQGGGAGGCCAWGGQCADCGSDGSGWCHQSASTCGSCGGSFLTSKAKPSCR